MLMKITSIDDANKALERFIPSSAQPTKYNLDAMNALMKYLGNPQDKLKVIHVAGTSGKTSTCYYAAGLLVAAGYNVGHSVSPHIDSVSERAQINLRTLGESDYCSELTEFLEHVEKSGVDCSYFEVLVAFAYWLFAKHHVEYVVMEVGLGGLLDATNVISRPDKICIITDIGYDHMNVLGATLGEISKQKAGIICNQNNVFMYTQSDEVMKEVERTCRDNAALLHLVRPSEQIEKNMPLFQQRNYYLAVQAVICRLNIDAKDPLTESDLQTSRGVYIPGRMEVVEFQHKTLIMDGSHNQQKIGALVESVKMQFPNKSITLLVSFGENKRVSVKPCLLQLHELTDAIIITSFSKSQDELHPAMNIIDLAREAKKVGFKNIQVESDPVKASSLLLGVPTDIMMVTGSLYLLNHIRPLVEI